MLRVVLLLGVVACGRPALTFTPEALPEGKVGVPYHASITIANAETPLANVSALTPLPPGLRMRFESHTDELIKIEGTPTEAGTTAFTIDASCFGTSRTGQHGRRTFDLVIR